jgi:ribose 1,5-bisphosphokinase PhnN
VLLLFFMSDYEAVVVVGSSGSGKTTVVNGLRTPEYAGHVVVPHRYITRPPRAGDDMHENSHMAHGAFELNVRARIITPHWSRTLDNDRVERYGFDRPKPKDDRLRVYSANNAFLRDKNETVQKALERALVVVVMASDETREDRLGTRSPDMSDEERAVRLHDSGADMLEGHVEVLTIDTSQLTPEGGQTALRGIVDRII